VNAKWFGVDKSGVRVARSRVPQTLFLVRKPISARHTFSALSEFEFWTSYSNQSFMAGIGTRTTVRVPVNRQKAFFKIVRVAD